MLTALGAPAVAAPRERAELRAARHSPARESAPGGGQTQGGKAERRRLSALPAGSGRRGSPAGPPAERSSPQQVLCLHAAVALARGFGGDVQRFALTRCDGRPAPRALEELSLVARPLQAPKRSAPAGRVGRAEGEREGQPGITLLHEGLVTRLQAVLDHFRASGVTIVSGYRPNSRGSYHQSARALDVHVDGVRNEDLVAFCRTLPDTGCGYYPNSSFVHIDVRPPSTGHVYWIDAAGPGEPPRYVATWPLTQPAGAPRAFLLPCSIAGTLRDVMGTSVLSRSADDPFAP